MPLDTTAAMLLYAGAMAFVVVLVILSPDESRSESMPVEVQVYVATEGRIEDGSPIVTARVVGHLGGRFDRTVYVLELPCGRVVFRGVHECAQPSQRQWQIPFSRN